MIDFVKEIAQETGKVLLPGSRAITRNKAGSGSWVTEADLAAAKLIVEEAGGVMDSKMLSREIKVWLLTQRF